MKTLTFKLNNVPHTQEIPYDARPRKISAFSVPNGVKVIASAPDKLVDPGTPRSSTTWLFDFRMTGNEELTELKTYVEGVTDVSITADTETEMAELKAQKRVEIWGAGDAILAQVKANYTGAEIESWSKQEEGAKDIQAGKTDTEAALFVAAIAQGRGIETQTLVTKILGNVVSYGALSSAVIGEQQRLDDLIKVATTQAQLDAIVWTLNPLEA